MPKKFQVDRNLQIQFKLSKQFKGSGNSGFLFWAIEPIRKDENDGKFREPHFSGTWSNSLGRVSFFGFI